jgi:hypothetical protein
VLLMKGVSLTSRVLLMSLRFSLAMTSETPEDEAIAAEVLDVKVIRSFEECLLRNVF